MRKNELDNKTRLDSFFDMLDAIEEDISQVTSDDNEEATEIGGYECLFISFNNLQLYCEYSGVNLEQINDQYQALKASPANEESGAFPIQEDLVETNEVVNFCKLLEQIENSLSAFEQRCENSEEVFDEWSCVLIMYSYLRNYCVKQEVDFENLQQEISHLHAEMKKDENVILIGEDVAGGAGTNGEQDAWGGVMGVTKGLLAQFGRERIIDTPITETAILGMASGAALTGLRPIAELMFVDFMGVCFDQILNQTAKFRYMFGGKAITPLTIRTMYGGGVRAASQHSQCLYPIFTHVPGIKAVSYTHLTLPTTPYV